ncbi:MAG: hypothetical protein CME24_11295 [Gemmatimonadetes bacterium]|nr:hypothetical protein [Gemmatimonadota bacterium]
MLDDGHFLPDVADSDICHHPCRPHSMRSNTFDLKPFDQSPITRGQMAKVLMPGMRAGSCPGKHAGRTEAGAGKPGHLLAGAGDRVAVHRHSVE